MIAKRKMISSVSLLVDSRSIRSNEMSTRIGIQDIKNTIGNIDYVSVDDSFEVARMQKNRETTISSGIFSPVLAANSYAIGIQTTNITEKFSLLKKNLASLGEKYANNTFVSRSGFMAEKWHEGTYNLDSAIKKSSTRATMLRSNAKASADIIYDNNKEASLKYYKDASSSAKAQTNPNYGDQARIVPSDQVSEVKSVLKKIADHNLLKGRGNAAEIQNKTEILIDDRIRSGEKVTSTPLSKKDSLELAKAIRKDENGNVFVDKKQMNNVLKDNGVIKKVNSAIIKNELKGIGIAAAIGLGTGFAIGFLVGLAQNGLNPDSIKHAFTSSVEVAGESAILATGSTILGRTIGDVASKAFTDLVLNSSGKNIAENIAHNISKMCNLGVVGSLTIMAFSVYQFAKLKLGGYSTKESLLRTGKSAMLSFSVLLISIVAQGIYGGSAGIVVSIVAGVIVTGISVRRMVRNRKIAERITLHSIELCRPIFN